GHATELLPDLRLLVTVGVLGHERYRPAIDPALDGAPIHPAHLRDLSGDLAEQLPGVERGVQELGHREEGAALLEPATGLPVEPRVADRHARLGHEALEELLVVGTQPDRLA